MLVPLLAACGRAAPAGTGVSSDSAAGAAAAAAAPDGGERAVAGGSPAPAAAPGVVPLRPPPLSAIPGGPLGASIRRGRAILLATRDSLPGHVGNGLRCVSCHLDEGRRAWSSPWAGVYGQFPQYRSRGARVITLEERINGCFQRSMSGKALAVDDPAMRDIVSYIAWLSTGVPVGARVEGQGLRKLPALEADTAAGARTFATVCARCHGPEGQGTELAPPLWGPRSFNIGAGMARPRTAAGFIRANMPFDHPGTLSDQQAVDVAAFVRLAPPSGLRAEGERLAERRSTGGPAVPYEGGAAALRAPPRRGDQRPPASS